MCVVENKNGPLAENGECRELNGTNGEELNGMDGHLEDGMNRDWNGQELDNMDGYPQDGQSHK